MSHPPSEEMRVRRNPKRGAYDKATIYSIVDAAYVGTVAYTKDGTVRQIPMAMWREEDAVYIHGSTASQLMQDLASGIHASMVITHIDGLVLARSAFHHSMNYRSVIIQGKARRITDPVHKEKSLDRFMDHLFPGRRAEVRPPTTQEIKGTMVLAFDLDQSSAKIRSGGPKDDAPDYALPVWAGVVPLNLTAGPPLPDERLAPETPTPSYLNNPIHNR